MWPSSFLLPWRTDPIKFAHFSKIYDHTKLQTPCYMGLSFPSQKLRQLPCWYCWCYGVKMYEERDASISMLFLQCFTKICQVVFNNIGIRNWNRTDIWTNRFWINKMNPIETWKLNIHISHKPTWRAQHTFPEFWINLRNAAFKQANIINHDTTSLPSCSVQYFPTPLWPDNNHQEGNEVSEVPQGWSNQASCIKNVVQNLLPQNQDHLH